MVYIAHKSLKNDEIQCLSSHLINVGDLCAKTGEKIGLKHSSFLLGICHDMGKYSLEFQNYIQNNTNAKVNHSSAGGVYLYDKLIAKVQEDDMDAYIIAEIFAYVVFAHHGLFDLIDFNSDISDGFKRRYEGKNEDYEYFIGEFLSEISPLLIERKYKDIDGLIESSFAEMMSLLSKIKSMSKDLYEYHYYIHCVVRLLLSILKDGDIYDSANAFLGEKLPRYDFTTVDRFFQNGHKNIEARYKKFAASNNKSPLNDLRSSLSLRANEKASEIKQGLVMASLPTGSGKTLLTTRFALANAISSHKKDRIFYITAFLSVLEQNANEIRGFFDDDSLILEHHSNVVQEVEEGEDEERTSLNYYLQNSWEVPCILTTMVQYANTQFKGRSANIRRFCKYINSVIIIDEVQSMPLKMTYMHNLMTNFMSEIMGAVIVHATATQPVLDSSQLKYKAIFNATFPSIAKVCDDEASLFKRTRQYYLDNEYDEGGTFDLESLSEDILAKLDEKDSILIILNTKKAVNALYQRLKEGELEDVDLVQLSTNKTADHRLREIAYIKKVLADIRQAKTDKKIICISTALIEAGVDVDFEVVYRSLAPVPSLIQSMGRCNREGKMDFGEFYIFDYKDENIKPLKEVYQGMLRTKDLLSDRLGEEVDLEKIKDDYYNKLYLNIENELYFNTDKDDLSLFELLSVNKKNRTEYKMANRKSFKRILGQNFKKAASSFEMIEQENTTVIVRYGEDFKYIDEEAYTKNNSLIDELENALKNYDYKRLKFISKALQPFTLSVRDIKSIENFLMKIGDFYILNEANYDDEIGLNKEELELLIF